MSRRAFQNSIEDELIFMRKNLGFTLARFQELISLPKVFGGKNIEYFIVKAQFIFAINMLADKEAMNILMVAYGLKNGFENMTLTERRSKYMKNNNTSYKSSDLLLDKETRAITELAKILVLIYEGKYKLPKDCEKILLDETNIYFILSSG